MYAFLTTSLVVRAALLIVSSFCLFGGSRNTLVALCLYFVCVRPTTQLGFALLVTGAVRQKSAASVMYVLGWCAPSSAARGFSRLARMSWRDQRSSHCPFVACCPYPELVLTLCFLGHFVVAPLLFVPASLFSFWELT